MSHPQNCLEELGKSIEKRIICNPFIFLFIVGIIIALIMFLAPTFSSLDIRNSIDIAGLFWGTTTIVAIVERSIELFIAAWRNPGKRIIEQDITILKEKTFQSLPQEKKDRINEIATEIETLNKEIDKSNQEKNKNKSDQQNKIKEFNDQENVIEEMSEKMDKNAPELKEEKEKLDEIRSAIGELSQKNDLLAENLKKLENQKKELEDKHLATLLIDLNNDTNNTIKSPAKQLDLESIKLTRYETDTAYYALYLGIGFGLFASFAGIRILEPLVDISQLGKDSPQINVFYKLDLVVSALAIAGGTKLFHGLPALISDTLSSTRNLVNKQ